jgi:hypothetical protein
MARRNAFAALSCLTALSALSCLNTSPGGSGFEIQKTYYTNGNSALILRVTKQRISTAEEIGLRIEARVPRGWSAELPEIASLLGGFQVGEARAESRILDREAYLVLGREYTLIPFLPGEYAIPPLSARFTQEDGGSSFSLISESIPITVTSVLPPQLGEQDIEDISGPARLPSYGPLWIGGGVAALLAAGGTLLVWRLRRGAAARLPKGANPGDAALQALQRLLDSGLAEQRRHREFYAAITDIARGYVEQRFSIRAPEQTTEELLHDARASEALAGFTPFLEQFLWHCDLVKFAKHSPSAEEVARTVSACRSFIIGTSPGRPRA